MTHQGRQLFPVQGRVPQFAYRFIRRVYVFGTQTRGCDKPFQHPPFCFDHLRFFFLSIETTVIITCVSFDAWTIEEFVRMAASVWVEREYIAKLLRKNERHIRHERQSVPYVRLES